VIPLADAPPSDLVIAWNSAHTTPLIRSFVSLATALTRS
jgi:hypothetical protein